MVKNSKRRQRVEMTGGGTGLVNHAGARLLADVADRLGLTAGLSAAMAPTKQRRRGHDRGDVLVDLAVAIADGATTISDLAVLRNQPELFGEVASHPTAWRTLDAIDNDTSPGSVLDALMLAGGRGRRVRRLHPLRGRSPQLSR